MIQYEPTERPLDASASLLSDNKDKTQPEANKSHYSNEERFDIRSDSQSKKRIIRLPEVMHRLGISRSSVYLKISRHELSPPLKLGGVNSRAVGWLESDINNYLENLVTESKSNGGTNA